MLRISALAAAAVLISAPAFAMGCSYGNHSTSASAESYVPKYSPTAASATTEEVVPLQSTPIDPAAIVLENDAVIETADPAIVPEG